MSYGTFPVGQFSGLRLDAEPDEVGPEAAIDLLNVDFDKRGALRVRDGYTSFASTANFHRSIDTYASDAPNLFQVVASRSGVGLDAYDSSGVLIASTTTANTGGRSVFVRWGSPTVDYVYATGQGGKVSRWDGSTWTQPAGIATCFTLGVQTVDNRLVIGFLGASEYSKVAFSDAGAAETFGANNYVRLTPGDGQYVSAIVSWRELMIVFKQSRFFVFYGNSTDSTGSPVFNYRTVEGAGLYSERAWAVAPEAVYFLGRDGLYKTTGGPPQKVGASITPWLQATTGPFWAGASFDPTASYAFDMTYLDRRLYLVAPTSPTTNVLWVYDIDADQWSYWGVNVAGLTAGRLSQGGRKELLVTNGLGSIFRFGPSYSTDNGTAIASRYRSGFYTVGNQPAQEAKIRETVIEGTGTPSLSVSRDYGSVPTSGGGAKTAVTLGTSPAIAQGRHRVSQRGRKFSYQIEATSGQWRVENLTHHTESVRPSGEKTA